METLKPEGINAEQIKYWNQSAAPKWIEHQRALDAQIEPLGLATMDRAGIKPGMRVLDVGCGCGATSLELARRAGAGGAVTAIDISTPMLEQARQAALRQGVSNISFLNADAHTYRFKPEHDLLFSRFGMMFFAEPREAFANLRTALKPTGKVAFVCWQAIDKNPWMVMPMMAAMKHIAFPPPPPPGAPGPFSFADRERVNAILSGAGFERIQVEPLEQKLSVAGGGDLDTLVQLLMDIGPTGAVLRQAADSGLRERIAGAIREALTPYYKDGQVMMDSGAWIVSAQNRG